MVYRSNIRPHYRNTEKLKEIKKKYFLVQNERRNYIFDENLLIALIRVNANVEIVQKKKGINDCGWWIGNDGDAYEMFCLDTALELRNNPVENSQEFVNYAVLLEQVANKTEKYENTIYFNNLLSFIRKNEIFRQRKIV